MPRDLYVSMNGCDTASGSRDEPFRSINHAAQIALPGDTVTVAGGEYREWVRPARGGIDESRRIIYRAAPGEHVVIKGSERVTDWQWVSGTTWQADVPNLLFGDFNPFAIELGGDWLVEPDPYRSSEQPAKHLGEVYLNGRSFHEVSTYEEVFDPIPRTTYLDHWTGLDGKESDPTATTFVWYARVFDGHTSIWANFQGADPNLELVEINVRSSVFAPTARGINYVTVQGFELAHAAPQWAPPTAEQQGLLAPNWAKGWLIEDNLIHDSKCSGISLGATSSIGDNYALIRGNKSGYQYQVEAVLAAGNAGWDKEHVGSHVVRGNTIYDCGQTAIVGHLGCIFSVIEDNHIYRIGAKREYFGHEIAGIKLHAAIDTVLVHNRIHDCSLGIWLDWETQGTRVSRNLMYSNNRDLFVEVSHGPYTVDHNILASPASLEVVCQGGAFVNNLVGGSVRLEVVLDRSTPYHLPHSTAIAGFGVVSGGDDRWIGNIFIGGNLDDAYRPGGVHHSTATYGTAGYSGYPASMSEYLAGIDRTLPDHAQFLDVRQPVYSAQNVYVSGARPVDSEWGALVLDTPATLRVIESGEGSRVDIDLDFPEAALGASTSVVTSADLPPTCVSDAQFEDALGRPLQLDVDLVGAVKSRDVKYPAGPLAGSLRPGVTRVW